MSPQHQEEPACARRSRVIYFLFGAVVGALMHTRYFWRWDMPWEANLSFPVIGAATLRRASAQWGDAVWL